MDGLKSTRPFVYVILPLILILVLGSLALTYHMRRRRYRTEPLDGWPGVHVMYGHGGESGNPQSLRTRNRLNRDWAAPPLEEGLNELGEAPPPYATKKPAVSETEHGIRPPQYGFIAPPPPAVTAS